MRRVGDLAPALKLAAIAVAVGLALPAGAQAGSTWKSKGELAAETRVFRPDNNAATTDYGIGMFGRVEVSHKHKPWREKLRGFGRVDTVDKQRSVLVLEEAWVEYKGKKARLRVGADVLNWSATEAFHPADIINSRNLDSDFESLEKIGEPMALLGLKIAGARVSLIGMPLYTEPILASPKSRLNFAQGLPSRPGRIQLDSRGRENDRNFGGQGALLVERTIRAADLALHVVHHLDRSQPVFIPATNGGPGHLLFQTVTQSGLTYQHAIASILAKLEFGYRAFHSPDSAATARFGPLSDRDHAQIALGLEYTYTHANSIDSTLLLESQALAGVDNKLQRRGLSLFQRDLLVGYRLAFNDVKDKQLLLLGILDLENAGEQMWSLAYSQRLSDDWSIDGSLRYIHTPDPDPMLPPTGLEALRKADQVRLALTRYF